MFGPRIVKKMFELLGLKKEKEQGNANSFFQDSVKDAIGEFKYSPEEEVTFAVYFHCYEEVVQKDCTTWLENKSLLWLGTDSLLQGMSI